MASLSQLLSEAQSPLAYTRETATSQLQQRKVANSISFLEDLAGELCNESAQSTTRQLAGLLLKNTLKNSSQEEVLTGLWEKLPTETRSLVKRSGLSALGSSEKSIRQTAAQVVAELTILELDQGRWEEIFDVLVSNSTHSIHIYRQSAIMTLGFLMEELTLGRVPQTRIDQILTVLCANSSSEQSENEVRVEAIKALGYALRFASSNFAVSPERNLLMTTILTCCKAPNSEIRAGGLSALCEVALLYYDYLLNYLPDLWTATSAVIFQDKDREVLLALEFWNIIGEIECDRNESDQENKPIYNLLASVSTSICPVLCQGLLRHQGEGDEWTIQKSCGAQLIVLSALLGDSAVDLCRPFLVQNISHPDSSHKEAAVLILGAIMEGPTSEKLSPLIAEGVPILLALSQDSNPQIRQAVSWTISRLCEFQFSLLMTNPSASALFQTLIQNLSEGKETALRACASIIHILKHSKDTPVLNEESFQRLFSTLIELARRSQSVDLHIAAFTAIESMIQESSPNLQLLVEEKFAFFLTTLQDSLRSSQVLGPTQTLLCSVLEATCRVYRPELLSDNILKETIETIVSLFLAHGRVLEEGINVLGTIVGIFRLRTLPFLSLFIDYLITGLSAQNDQSLCKASVVCVGESARGFEEHISPYLPRLLPPLISLLESPSVNIDVKIQSIASLGDLANSTKVAFLPYVAEVMVYIESAAQVSLQVVSPEQDIDLWEYLQELREGIIDFYSSLLQGMTEVQQTEVLLPYALKIMQYISVIVQGSYTSSTSTHVNVLGLIGDIALAHGTKVRDLLCSEETLNYVRWQEAATDAQLKTVAKWTLKQIKKIDRI